jgi:putative endonuclease
MQVFKPMIKYRNHIRSCGRQLKPVSRSKSTTILFFMAYTVYVLYSDSAKKHYTGYSSDLENRIASHNIYGSDWTSKFRPWRLIYSKTFDEKSEAIKYEKYLKTGAGRDFLKYLKM